MDANSSDVRRQGRKDHADALASNSPWEAADTLLCLLDVDYCATSAMRMTVGRSTASMRRSYIGLICDASTFQGGSRLGGRHATDGGGACTLDALSFIKSAHPLTARSTNGSAARKQKPSSHVSPHLPRRYGLGGSTSCAPPSVTCAYIPGNILSFGLGKSISTRMVRVAGSSAVAMRVTVPSTVIAAAP